MEVFNMKRRTLQLCTFLCLLFVCIPYQSTAETNQAPLPIVEGRMLNQVTLVPMRAIFEALGADMTWEGETRTVTARKDGKMVSVTIGVSKVTVNDLPVELDQPALLIGERTFVPARLVSEALGAKVEWREKEHAVLINNALRIEVNQTPVRIGTVFSANKVTMEAKAKMLEPLLASKLGRPVMIRAYDSYEQTLGLLESKQLDAAFLPPTGYITAKSREIGEVLVQALRYGIEEGTGKQDSNRLVNDYRSMLIVPKDSPIQSLEDLKGKRIAVQAPTSSAGFVYPLVELKEQGIDPVKDTSLVTILGHDRGVMALKNNQADAAAIFEDARSTVLKDWPTVFEDTRVLYYTRPIPNDTIVVQAQVSEEHKVELRQALQDTIQEKQGRRFFYEITSWQGLAPASDVDFDIFREADREISSITQ
jgi:phosphonate transport system substrate-binding protein